MKIQFKEWACTLQKGKYANNNRVALTLIDSEDGECITTCTVNLPEYPLEEGYVIIKDYSENEGILETLITAGVISEPVGYINSGFVTVPVCKLLI